MSRKWARLMMTCSLVMAIEVPGPRDFAWAQDPIARREPATESVDEIELADPSTAFSSRPLDPPTRDAGRDNSVGWHLLNNLAEDQKAIWTSPGRLRLIDADWLLPLGLIAGGMLATDTGFSKHLSNSPTRLKYSRDLSNYGIAAMAAAGGGFYFLGRITHDDHKRETGILAGEAAMDSYGVTSAFKYAFGRERPQQDDYRGKFRQGANSMPSEHAAAAWSIASVIAHEYPGPLTTFLAYGAATAVSMSRVTAKEHFPSDVLIGSAIGWFVGQHVYRAHHDPELGGKSWESYVETREESPGRKSKSVGSPYVELDSWVYPALERLAALGYIHTDFLSIRPWTRIECAQLVEEAEGKIEVGKSTPNAADRLYWALASEFHNEIEATGGGEAERTIRLESVYSGVTGISGQPLNDSYHFGQTISNNYGRPYEKGFSTYSGFSGWGREGRFVLYVRGEYQHAPSAPAYSQAIRNAIAVMDSNPVQPASPISEVNQFRLLDTYVAANVAGWNLAFGKQSLWWGTGFGSALMFSDNAEPIYMFRASRITPITLPWVFHWLGPMKQDYFFGKLSGNHFPAGPVIHGEKISFKPTPNLELGFSRTSEFGGVGRAITPAAIFNSYVSFRESIFFQSNANPGKRSGGFDFSYRVPYLRNWLKLYTEGYTPDDPSPLGAGAQPRSAIVSGFYLARLPNVPNLDLRVEAVNTDTPNSSKFGQFVYFDHFYHDLYTNNKNIIGSWIGREGTGIQAWSTYWFTSRNALQFGYRHAKVDNDFVPGGETVNDGSIKLDCWLRRDLNVKAFVQYEKWRAPILAANPQTNWTTTLEIGFWPSSWRK
jgi:membrane-associated phospholipid phosphatase